MDLRGIDRNNYYGGTVAIFDSSEDSDQFLKVSSDLVDYFFSRPDSFVVEFEEKKYMADRYGCSDGFGLGIENFSHQQYQFLDINILSRDKLDNFRITVMDKIWTLPKNQKASRFVEKQRVFKRNQFLIGLETMIDEQLIALVKRVERDELVSFLADNLTIEDMEERPVVRERKDQQAKEKE